MIRSFFIAFFLTFVILLSYHGLVRSADPMPEQTTAAWWPVQSVDTMKYSRDSAWQALTDTSFQQTINEQVSNIAKLGATHVAIATPYDAQFVPALKLWVKAARTNGLHVWFRGNFSGWEEWFDYKRIDRAEHLRLTREFITANADLFEDGDIFTPCPECENGGPGDPRKIGDIEGYRQFLISEYETSRAAFRQIGKGIEVGYFSMNYDVATLIMDQNTTEALGGIVTIDHYVASPSQLAQDVRAIAHSTGGQVFLGEFGAPIPDIHGDMNEQQQYDWIYSALTKLQAIPELVGVNYWVSVGGSTQLWTESGTKRKAADALSNAFHPNAVRGVLVNQLNKPIKNSEVSTAYRKVTSNASGQFILPYISTDETVTIHADTYTDTTIQIATISQNPKIIIEKKHLTWFERILDYIHGLFK